MGNGKKKGRYGAIGIVSMLLLTVLGFGLYLADWDDLLFATAKNERVMAIVYTPNLAPGDRAWLRCVVQA